MHVCLPRAQRQGRDVIDGGCRALNIDRPVGEAFCDLVLSGPQSCCRCHGCETGLEPLLSLGRSVVAALTRYGGRKGASVERAPEAHQPTPAGLEEPRLEKAGQAACDSPLQMRPEPEPDAEATDSHDASANAWRFAVQPGPALRRRTVRDQPMHSPAWCEHEKRVHKKEQAHQQPEADCGLVHAEGCESPVMLAQHASRDGQPGVVWPRVKSYGRDGRPGGESDTAGADVGVSQSTAWEPDIRPVNESVFVSFCSPLSKHKRTWICSGLPVPPWAEVSAA